MQPARRVNSDAPRPPFALAGCHPARRARPVTPRSSGPRGDEADRPGCRCVCHAPPPNPPAHPLPPPPRLPVPQPRPPLSPHGGCPYGPPPHRSTHRARAPPLPGARLAARRLPWTSRVGVSAQVPWLADAPPERLVRWRATPALCGASCPSRGCLLPAPAWPHLAESGFDRIFPEDFGERRIISESYLNFCSICSHYKIDLYWSFSLDTKLLLCYSRSHYVHRYLSPHPWWQNVYAASAARVVSRDRKSVV